MKTGLSEKIKSRGYWRINFQPLVAAQKLPTVGACKDLIQSNSVELRGWDYPHFPQRVDADSGAETGNDHYQGWVDWEAHKEFWRIYQSGQFIHYLGLREDWMDEDSWFTSANQIQRKPGEALSVVGTVYQITEIFEFISRLTKRGLYEEGARIALSLQNTAQRGLWLNSPNRVPLSGRYITGASEISFDKEYAKDDLTANSKELAFDIIIQIFDRFGWHAPNSASIKRDQEDLLAKRL